MSESYTAEDFARANVAMRSTDGVARRVAPESDKPWRASWIPDFDWLSDEDMAADGWMPVRVANGRRDRDTYIDHIADQDRVIRRRNDEIKALRRELADAQAPLSLDSLAAAWEAAEVPTEEAPIREGDVILCRHDEGKWKVRIVSAGDMVASGRWNPTVRILSRAPKREPWADLEDAIREYTYEPDPKWLAQALYQSGVRVTGGDES